MAFDARELVIRITTKLVDGGKALKELAGQAGKAISDVNSKASGSATDFLSKALKFGAAVQAGTSGVRALTVAMNESIDPAKKAEKALGALPFGLGQLSDSLFELGRELSGSNRAARTALADLGRTARLEQEARTRGGADLANVQLEIEQRRLRNQAQAAARSRSPEARSIMEGRLNRAAAERSILSAQNERLVAEEGVAIAETGPGQAGLAAAIDRLRLAIEKERVAAEELKRSLDEAKQAEPRNSQLGREATASVDSVINLLKSLNQRTAQIENQSRQVERDRQAQLRSLQGG